MKNIFKQIISRKEQIIEDISAKTVEAKTPEEQIRADILSEGYVVYLADKFKLSSFIQALKEYLNGELGFETQTLALSDDIFEIKYTSEKGLKNKLKINENYKLYILKEDTELMLLIKAVGEHAFASNLISKLSSSEEDKIINYVETYMLSKFEDVDFDAENIFIQDTSLNIQIWYQSVRDTDEILLTLLYVYDIKPADESIDTEKIKRSFFIITDKAAYLVGFDTQNEVVFFSDINGEIKKHKGVVRDTFEVENLKWTSERTNAKLFSGALFVFNKFDKERLTEAARLNFLAKNYESALNLLNKHFIATKDIYTEFLIIYIKFIQEKVKINEAESVLRKIAADEQSGEKLLNIVHQWEIPEADTAMIADIIVKLAQSPEQKEQLSAFYAHIRKDFIKRNKDIISLTLFDLVYAEFLIDAGKIKDAVKVLHKRLKNLPDESVSDLLPAPDMDVTGIESGQILKVKLLDLLIKAGDKVPERIVKVAELQPLNISRLSALAAADIVPKSARAEEILKVLTDTKNYEAETKLPEIKQSITDKIAEANLRHPTATKGGSFYSMQKWLSKIKGEDYTAVKTFSDRLESKNHPELFQLVNEMKKAFALPDLETFLARGEKSNHIIAYEGTPPFIIIGYDFINDDSELKLSPAQMRYALASEMTHIMFKHTRVTSTDLWRGAADKGYLFLDTLFNLIPMAGLIGKAVKNTARLNKLAKTLQFAEKLSGAGDLFAKAVYVSEFYKKVFPKKGKEKDEKKQNLLAASRIMQYTADRAGVLFAGDIYSAVKSLFVSNKNYVSLWKEIEETNLHQFLLQTGDDGNYKHQDIALRLAAMLSFYMSDDYDVLVAKLYKPAE